MALSETPDLLGGTKGTVFLRRFPLLPALRKIVFKEDESSCLSGGILTFHTGCLQFQEGALFWPEMR